MKKEGKNKNMKYVMVLIYLILTVSGLILYKKGVNKEFLINISNNTLNLKLSVLSIIGLLCYLASFCMYMLILPKFDLTVIMPIVTAISSVSIYILSILVLKESVTMTGVVGTIMIFIGVLIVNFKGK